MYDHDLEELEALGWEEFIARQWESIFIGYRSWVGRRSMARRWSDLFEVGLGCPQEIAGWLARTEIMDRADRDLEGAGANVEALVSGMIGVVADLRTDLAEIVELGPELSGQILDQQARLLSFVRACASGQWERPGRTWLSRVRPGGSGRVPRPGLAFARLAPGA